MEKKDYQFKKCMLPFKVKGLDAEKIHNKLMNLKEKGKLTPEGVVAEAKKKNSVLHKVFEWDEKKGHYDWLLHQARNLIQSITVTIITKEREVIIPVFQSVPKKEYQGGREYKSTEDILNDVDETARVMENFRMELEYVRNKYEDFTYLASQITALDTVLEELNEAS